MRGEKGVARLFSDGKWGFCYPFRYIFRIVDGKVGGGIGEESGTNANTAKNGSAEAIKNGGKGTGKIAGEGVKVLFSVPKKNHKRAVARNLLKRRTREAYRLNKAALYCKAAGTGRMVELAIIYSSKEIHDYKTINNGVRRILGEIMERL